MISEFSTPLHPVLSVKEEGPLKSGRKGTEPEGACVKAGCLGQGGVDVTSSGK